MGRRGRFPPNFIETLRRERDWTLEQLAERMVPPTSAQQVQRYEKSTRDLTNTWLRRFARALECTTTDILEGPVAPQTIRERRLIRRFRGLSDVQQTSLLSLLPGDDPAEDSSNGAD